eukprot:CAMPEP_0197579752 /NCGR_PEP_ID=MMETSP1326-20131121/3691_1 /TAXON_ID=1155430 /ORGANISM="Genus nov. species nov., Strain RCC2288" /LENGTH=188 /DNA_ID=CAMNT_0043143301 /DNA_START=46 /DNA_END=608 /DNA_ORIENTATION=-
MSACCSMMAAPAATTRVPTSAPRVVGRRAAAARTAVVSRAGREETNSLTGESGWVQKSDATEGIEEAQSLYEAGDLNAAVQTLEGALKMSGSGTRRDRSKPAELSTGERQAIFYNLMACHSKLGNVERSLEAMEATLRAGYGSASLYGFGKAAEDYDRLMADPDLVALREDAKFKQVIGQYKIEPSEL